MGIMFAFLRKKGFIFQSYGQTGSGKTYTIIGGEEDNSRGILPRAVDLIFDRIEFLKTCGWEFQISLSFTELYNDKLYNLLSKQEQKVTQFPLSIFFYLI